MTVFESVAAAPPRAQDMPRLHVAGKFFSAGEEKFRVRGVTYGTFKPDEEGNDFQPDVVERDFEMIARYGFNAVRVYVVPPLWLLDTASRYGLRVLAGLPWPSHTLFLGDRRQARAILRDVRAWVGSIAGDPALLGIALANEIPASVVRFYGRRRVERFLGKLHRVAREAAPRDLFTYVNYPSTEYLDLPFLDFLSFNLFIEDEASFADYLPRLQNLAGDRPLLLTELGLDSLRNGEAAQADAVSWQVRQCLNAGCAGGFVFSWTDDWYRGGQQITDWGFGLTTDGRQPKPSLDTTRDAFAAGPQPPDGHWPRISVVVCTYNGARTIGDCLEGLTRLNYPDYEVIIVNDGSTDATEALVSSYPFRLITTANQGLSAARNEGIKAATGEIVAYTDDDARPDPDWLTYLAIALADSKHAGVGGPNIAPHGDGRIADAVAASPGGPIHVLISDNEAEHIPGCNMAFRREALEAVGGFDPRFRAAGDDVDICWRLRDAGYSLGFNAGAMVWHHRRNSIRAYWKQQTGYGKAEALLAQKWPERYNLGGHLSWQGRLYGPAAAAGARSRRDRVFFGAWGSAPFQRLYRFSSTGLAALLQTPDWYFISAGLIVLALLGLTWTPLLYGAIPLLALSLVVPGVLAFRGARASLAELSGGRRRSALRFGLTALLHLIQPPARLWGRLRHGLTPWRRRGIEGFSIPRAREQSHWSGDWQSAERKLGTIQAWLCQKGRVTRAGGDFETWDIEVAGGFFAAARLLLAVEEHGAGIQRFVFRTWPRFHAAGLFLIAGCASLAGAACLERAWLVLAAVGIAGLLLCLKTILEAGGALRSLQAATAATSGSRPPVGPDGGSAHKTIRYLPRVIPYLKPYRLLTVVALFITLLSSVSGLLTPWPLKILIDNVLSAEPLPPLLATPLGPIGRDTTSLLIFAVVSSLAIHLVVNFLSVASEYVTTKLELSIVLDFRSDLFAHAQRLSVPYADQVSTGRMMYGVNFEAAAAGALLVTLLPLLQSGLTLVGMLWIAFKIDPTLALLSLTVVPLLTYSVRFYAKRIQPELQKVKGLEMEALSIVHEAMQLLRVVTAFGKERHEYDRYRSVGSRTVDQRVRLTVKQTLFSLVVNMTTAAGTALVLGFGAYHALHGRLTAGELLVVLSYIASVYQPLEAISNTIGALQDRFVGLQIAFHVLDTPPQIQEAPNAVELGRTSGHVVFEDVSFDYPGRSGTLQHISFEAKPGEIVAIVGPTGAGKSTLMSLLTRFYDAQQGRIALDGVDVRDAKLTSLREQVAVVLQEPLLFSGTIADNIRYARFEASDDDVLQAATAANCHDFIMRLPLQYDSLVGERGVQLSGGERQRICVARAFLKDAPILILDEPTSSIDSRTEALILDALDDLMRGRTTFIIAHRLSTIRHADKILVIENGELVEQGTHEELLGINGTYKQLYEMQTSWAQRVRRMEPALESVVAGMGGSENEIRALLGLEEVVAACNDESSLAVTAIDWSRGYLGAEAAAFVVGKPGLEARVVAAEPAGREVAGRALHGSLLEKVLQTGQPQQVERAVDDPWLQALAGGMHPQSAAVCLPVFHSEDAVQGLLVFTVRERLAFDVSVLRLAGHTLGRRLASLSSESMSAPLATVALDRTAASATPGGYHAPEDDVALPYGNGLRTEGAQT